MYRVTRFVEKPDAEKARAFLADGRYLWNSGMFVFSAARYLEELDRYRPDVLAAASRAWKKGTRDLDFLRLDGAAFGECPSVSVDYAVMEKTERAAVVAADMGWSDVDVGEAVRTESELSAVVVIERLVEEQQLASARRQPNKPRVSHAALRDACAARDPC